MRWRYSQTCEWYPEIIGRVEIRCGRGHASWPLSTCLEVAVCLRSPLCVELCGV